MDIIHKKYNTEFTSKLVEYKHIFDEIYRDCNYSFMYGCGSYLFDGQTYTYCDLMYEKQELLYSLVKNKKKVLEIGTYMGHSLLIMLLSNPTLKITCIDISDKYAGPSINILNKYFNNAITFIHKDSLSALPTINDSFDFFHIDGHHENDYITKEFNLVKNLNDPELKSICILFDDQSGMTYLQEQINKNYKIINYNKPNCKWNNVYYELAL